MAEGFGRSLGKGIITVRSGGTEEGHEVDPLVIEVMHEVGIDISNLESKKVDSWDWADRLFIMGFDAEESCPVSYLHKLENWDLDNPKGKHIEEYRKVRDLIKEKIEILVEQERKVSS